MKTSKTRSALFVLLILNMGLLMKDVSSRSVVEEVFNLKVDRVLEPGELNEVFVAPSKPFSFIACNDTEHAYLFAAFSNFDYENSEWVASGWLPLSKGCSIIDSNMRGPVFGYAITKDRSVVWSGGEGSYGAPFCVNHKDSFKVPDSMCEKSLQTNLGMKKNYYELIHSPNSKSRVAKPVFWRIKSSKGIFAH